MQYMHVAIENRSDATAPCPAQLKCDGYIYFIQVAELASLAQLLPPRSPTVRNPAPDSSLCRLQSCSPISSASAAARRLRPRFSCCSRARLRHPLQLLLPLCLRFQQLLPDCARFICCSPLASASIQLLLPIASTWLLLPDCVHFNCCSPITSASTAAPRLRLLDSTDPNILRGVRGSVNKLKYEGRVSL